MKSPKYNVWKYIENSDTEVLKELGIDAEVVPLPGHTLGLSGILKDGVLYCGDAFTCLGGAPRISPNVYDVELMKDSLRKILGINPEWIAPGHGYPCKWEVARPVIERYLER
jgi:glyoxylase-like metal-dependent hydrolase (beta-lactamase superfamily II)